MSQVLESPNQASTPSTVVEPRQTEEPRTANGALDAPENPPEKPGSVRDAVSKAWDEQDKAAEPKAGEKSQEEPKEKPAEEGKTAPKDGEVQKPQDGEKEKLEAAKTAEAKTAEVKPQDEAAKAESERRPRPDGRPFYDPPKTFLPAAKENWSNVPNTVKAEVDRLVREHETEKAQYRESHENWTKLAKFDQMAKQHGSSVSDALERYTAVDHMLHNNPLEGIRQVLQTVGITPQQYAEFITKNPHASQPQRQPAQPDPNVQRATQEVQSLREEMEAMKQQQAAREIIEPFKAKHDRYEELEEDIVFFLKSGKIPTTLSPTDRLAAAYDMAERVNPSSRRQPQQDEQVQTAPVTTQPVVDPRGEKSIRGGPSAGFDPAKAGRVKDRRASIAQAMADFGA